MKIHNVSIKPSWSNGYVSGLSHDRPGFDPPVVLYKFHNFFLKIEDRLSDLKI
jgi:hypothetical protein